MRPIRLTVLAAAALSAAGGGAAVASIGAGISAADVALAGTARPGKTYKLPIVVVKNTGTQPARYRLSVQSKPLPGTRGAPKRWISFSRNDVRLRAGQSRRIRPRLIVPRRARSAQYSGLIVVTARGGPGPAAGPRVGAAAATRLRFTVARRARSPA